MHRIIISLIAVVAASISAFANFNDTFCDSTLRLDMSFMSWGEHRGISVDNVCVWRGWHGRRVNLNKMPNNAMLELNLVDSATGDTIYRYSKGTSYDDYLGSAKGWAVLPVPRRDAEVIICCLGAPGDTILSCRYPLPQAAIAAMKLSTPVSNWEVLQQASDPDHSISIAFVAEGYTMDEMDKFMEDARSINEALFSHDAFAKYRDRFNVIAWQTLSSESGISVPSNKVHVRSALLSHFDSYGLARLLTLPDPMVLAHAIEGIPAEHIIVLANTDMYGGSGQENDYCIGFARGTWSPEVVVHEFGHSFGNLADEYEEGGYDNTYSSDWEPIEANITTLCNFDGKWQNLIDSGEASLIEGAGYQPKGVWRGCSNCLMRTVVDRDFCAVCTQALERLIRFYTEEQMK